MSSISIPPIPPLPERNPRRISDFLNLWTGIIVLLSAAVGFLANSVPAIWNSITSSPSAVIVSPADVVVQRTLPLFGTYNELPPDTLVWAVTQDMSNNRLYPQDKACTVSQGNFNCGTYYVGPDQGGIGSKYKIIIVSAPAKAADTFAQYQIQKGGPMGANPGLDSLPDSVTFLTSKEVVRGS